MASILEHPYLQDITAVEDSENFTFETLAGDEFMEDLSEFIFSEETNLSDDTNNKEAPEKRFKTPNT